MSLRLAGVALLLFSAFGWGMERYRREDRRREAIGQSIALIREIRYRIELYGTPVAELSVDPSMWEALTEALGKEGEILRSFLDALGRGYRADTLELCARTAELLDAQLRQMPESALARFRLYVLLPLLLAGAAVLWLI